MICALLLFTITLVRPIHSAFQHRYLPKEKDEGEQGKADSEAKGLLEKGS